MDSTDMWNTIQNLRRTKGTNAKKIMLENHPELQPVLRAAYNPFTQYGITPPAVGGIGTKQFSENTTFALLNQLTMGTLSGNRAKAAVASHLNELDYGSAQVLRCILNKTFDIGLAEKSINEVFPGLIPVHAIQLAKPIDWKRVSFPCYVSRKLDGLRAIYRAGAFYSRKGHVLEGLKTLTAAVQEALEGTDITALDGELMVPGVHFNEISGKIRSFNETPDAVYHVFDTPDADRPFYQRYNELSMLLSDSGPVQLVGHQMVYNREEIDEYYAEARAAGFEGCMVKNPDARYENSRSWAWQKVKNTDTVDLKVVGIYAGHGKYEGLLGGIYVDFNGVRVGVGSGLTDYQRNVWADEPEEIVGKTVEIAYQEVTPDGSLRHPRIIQVRGDK